jgi:hypothetical protein
MSTTQLLADYRATMGMRPHRGLHESDVETFERHHHLHLPPAFRAYLQRPAPRATAAPSVVASEPLALPDRTAPPAWKE